MRIEEVVENASEEFMEEIKGLRVSSLDEEEEGAIAEDDMNEVDEAGDDDDEEEDEYDDDDFIELGFLYEPEERWSLLRQMFPSKAGGVPAWLDPVNLPSGRSCLCDICGEPLRFLLQVYAPINEKEPTYHRTFFVFMCPSMTCLLRDQHEQWKRGLEKPSRSVKVFRCQLSRTNPFYSSEDLKRDGTDKPLIPGVPLCAWCGTWKGDKVCSSCRRTHYCCEIHQVSHWRASHKPECQQLRLSSLPDDGASLEELSKVACQSLWPEYEILPEEKDVVETSASEGDPNSDTLMPKQQEDDSLNSLMGSFEGDDDKKSWATFQEHTAKEPGQVLRFRMDDRSKPLWPTSSGRLAEADVPKCSNCGATRKFEFQILPQLLYFFNVKNDVDSLDWSTIVVYACSDSCEGNVPYKEEFAWVQLPSQNTIVA